MKYIVIHYHEIALKGKNRPVFERALVKNIKDLLSKDDVFNIKRLNGRILLELKTDVDIRCVLSGLEGIFGISSYSPALKVKSEVKDIEQAGVKLMKDVKSGSFKVESKRSYKQFPLNSLELSSKVGSAIFKATKLKVDVKHPKTTVYVEVLKDIAFVYREKINGSGGLPIGVSGKVLLLISGGIDSPIAAYKMMKRGCEVEVIHFHSYPYTDKASIEKVTELLKVLTKYQKKFRLHLVPIIDFQKEVVKKVEDKYRIVMYRRLMYRVAEMIAKDEKIKALVSGDNLGQVASQTIENMKVIGHGLDLPIFRPLLTYDKQEIIEISQKIGTFELSTEPHKDCCSLFLPKNPVTRAKLYNILEQEKNIDMEYWVKEVNRNTKILTIGHPVANS